MLETQDVFGHSLAEGRYLPSGRPSMLLFRSADRGSVFALDTPSVFQHLLLLGGSGSGKTNTLYQILPQLRRRTEEENQRSSFFVFDAKGDYVNHRGFRQPGDTVLGNGAVFRGGSAVWNIFEEILADGPDPENYEANAREIASDLFEDRRSTAQPFFANAARDIFAGVLIYFIRRRRDNPAVWKEKLNNEFLVQFLMGRTPEQFASYFRLYPDLTGLISYFGDGTSNQSLGVFGELRSMIYECFQGIFARKAPAGTVGFSIRRAMREKGGRAVFVEYDLSTGAAMTPMYRLLTDLALKEAMSSEAAGQTFFLLDELKLLPKVVHLEDALNFGRSKGVSVVAGLQSVDQIYAAYGRERGQVILGGFGSVFAFHTADFASREYVTRLMGPNIQSYRYQTKKGEVTDYQTRSGNTVEQWDQRALKLGQAVVGLASQDEPFLFTFEPDRF